MTQDKSLLGFKDSFCFECHPGLDCFTSCCADVTIFLTPFDVLRLTEHLEMDSSLFLATYTRALRGKSPVLPLVVLKMNEDQEGKPCPLVTPQGCSVYPARPWSCRMYPLDVVGRGQYRVMVEPDFCQGLKSKKSSRVMDYLTGQGVDESSVMDVLYQEITNHPGLAELDVDNPRVARMIHLACYDLDRFQDFVFESSFLEKFEVDQERLEAIKSDKVELLKFGFDWVKFGLFAEKTLSLKPGQKAQRGPGSG
ncbi:MAG: YkgJ family cysteine cluster protein [Deltaproteobacteria bacterium]|nr:YkgJ family cysteine cluster protein [Deltaproteobacteria bacterium]